jgi:hypothetical protein
MEKRFSASLSITSNVITAAVFLFTVAMTFFLMNDITESETPQWLVWAFPVFMGGMILGLYLYRPTAYLITPYSVVVSRFARDKVIAKTDITMARTVSKEEMGLPVRTFGNGGMFGFTGYYFSDRLGKMSWYATRTENYVLLQLSNGRKIILTPDDPTGFLAAFHDR